MIGMCFYEIMLYIVVDFGPRWQVQHGRGAQEKIVVDNQRIYEGRLFTRSFFMRPAD